MVEHEGAKCPVCGERLRLKDIFGKLREFKSRCQNCNTLLWNDNWYDVALVRMAILFLGLFIIGAIALLTFPFLRTDGQFAILLVVLLIALVGFSVPFFLSYLKKTLADGVYTIHKKDKNVKKYPKPTPDYNPKAFKVLFSVCGIGIVLSIGFMIMLPFATYYSGEPADSFDDWTVTPNARDGEVVTFRGRLVSKEHLYKDTYRYRFDDSDVFFKGRGNVGDQGEFVLVDMEIGKTGPYALLSRSYKVFALYGITLFILESIILLVVSIQLIKRRKANIKEGMPSPPTPR